MKMSFMRSVVLIGLLTATGVAAQEPLAGYYVDQENPDGIYGTIFFCDGPDEFQLASFSDTILSFETIKQDGKTILRLGQPPLSVFLSEDGKTLSPVGDYDKAALDGQLVWDRPC